MTESGKAQLVGPSESTSRRGGGSRRQELTSRLGGGAKQSPKAIVSDESKAKTNSLADVARESFAMLISVFAKRIYTLSGEAAFPVPHSRNGPRLLSENDISYSANNENLTLLANRYTWGISFPQVISRWLSRAQLRRTTIAG